MNLQSHRILCLWFPDWPVQRLLSSTPELRTRVLLLVENGKRGQQVAYCNRLAKSRGVVIGMPVAEARSSVRPTDQVVIQPVCRDEDRQAIEQLAIASEEFSPCVGVEDYIAPECLLMDVTGVAHCFGSEMQLVARMEQVQVSKNLEPHIAICNSVGSAWAAAHFLAQRKRPVVLDADSFDLLQDLPIEALRLEESTRRKLHRLGIKQFCQLTELDRLTLVPRFGNELLVRMDQFTGARPETITPFRPTPRFALKHDLENGITHPVALEQLWSSTLRRIVSELAARQIGTGHIHCQFVLQHKGKREVTVRLCRRVADAEHIADLLRLKLEHFKISEPVIGIRMEALDAAPLQQSQQNMFECVSDEDRNFSMLLNRLSTRLGPENVVNAQLFPDPVPERAIQYVPVTNRSATPPCITEVIHLFDRPTCLFPEPRPVEVVAVVPNGPPAVMFWDRIRFDISSCWGPERIESGWWRSRFVRRDYYRIETTMGQRFWLYRQLQDQRWFWHGEVL